jgi:hypothetical protein
MNSVKGRPHYYSYKKEEYAHIKFDLDAGTLTSLHSFHDPLLTLVVNRSQLPLQLEHKTSLPLPKGYLSILQARPTRLGSYNLGRDPCLRLRAMARKPLCTPRS